MDGRISSSTRSDPAHAASGEGVRCGRARTITAPDARATPIPRLRPGHGFSQMHWIRLCSNASRDAARAEDGGDEEDGPTTTMADERVHVDYPLNGLPASVDPLTNVVTMKQLKAHRGGAGCPGDVWMAIRGKVYNVSPYFKYHPGGEDQLRRGAGIDATKLFGACAPGVAASATLRPCLRSRPPTAVFATSTDARARSLGSRQVPSMGERRLHAGEVSGAVYRPRRDA